MTSNARRAELINEIATLHQQHLDSLSTATFTGWTASTEEAHEKRAKRIAALQLELNALEPSSEAGFPS